MNIFHLLAWLIKAYIWLIMFPVRDPELVPDPPGYDAGPDPVLPVPGDRARPTPGAADHPADGGLDFSFLVVILVAQIVLIPVLRA